MKGFVITLDAVIALTFVLFALVVISSQSYSPTAGGHLLEAVDYRYIDSIGKNRQGESGNCRKRECDSDSY